MKLLVCPARLHHQLEISCESSNVKHVLMVNHSDATGVHPITEEYAAKCGYTVRVLPLQGLELRASYFSCHTDNQVQSWKFEMQPEGFPFGQLKLKFKIKMFFCFQDDKVFTFRFNLITTHEGLNRSYTLGKSCPLALPWAPREVTCESNYMEVRHTELKNLSRIVPIVVSLQVSIVTDVTCPTVSKREDWDSAVQTVSFFFSCFVFPPHNQPNFLNCKTCSCFKLSPGLFLSQL